MSTSLPSYICIIYRYMQLLWKAARIPPWSRLLNTGMQIDWLLRETASSIFGLCSAFHVAKAHTIRTGVGNKANFTQSWIYNFNVRPVRLSAGPTVVALMAKVGVLFERASYSIFACKALTRASDLQAKSSAFRSVTLDEALCVLHRVSSVLLTWIPHGCSTDVRNSWTSYSRDG